MKNKAFTLVELAIALVIIGLIIASIASGTHLMQAAKINKAISEMSGYSKAIESFELKYHALPGDMINAKSFWSTANNGNGNEIIDNTEPLYAWQDMGLSGMISGSYTGANAVSPVYKSGVNVPGAVFDNTFYYIVSRYTSQGVGVFGTYGMAIQFSALDNAQITPWGQAVTPEIAYLIDKKADDGIPSSGNMYTMRGTNVSASNVCTSSNYTDLSATYLLNDYTTSCRIWYWYRKD